MRDTTILYMNFMGLTNEIIILLTGIPFLCFERNVEYKIQSPKILNYF